MRAALTGARPCTSCRAARTRTGLGQHRAVVRAADAAGVARIVYVSFVGAAADATFTLGRQHWATEQAIRDAGVAFTFLRSSLYLDFMPFFAGPERVIRGPRG